MSEMAFSEIGKAVGISKARAHRIEQAALAKLREEFDGSIEDYLPEPVIVMRSGRWNGRRIVRNG